MEKSDDSQSLAHVQPEDDAQQDGRPHSKVQQALRRALLESKRVNKELAEENSALKAQIASKEISWEKEKKQLLDEQASLVSTLFMLRNDFDGQKKTLEKFETEHKEMNKKMRAKEQEIRPLKKHLRFQQMETEKVKNQLRAESKRVKELQLSFEQSIAQFQAAWQSRWTAREEKAVTELTALQESCDKQVKLIMQEKDKAVTSARAETMALVGKNLENLAKLKITEAEIQKKQSEWQVQVKALEEKLRRAQEEKEEELQKVSRETEKWLIKQEDWFKKARSMEEDIQRLILQNIELQELALKSDKDRAKMRKEEKKVKKEAERNLKEEMKEKKKREEKEKAEREKEEKKERKEKKKQEEKEKAEREKEEKKERKEKKKQEEKEKAEREKEEKKERKEKKRREEKEKAEREKREKKEMKEKKQEERERRREE